MAQMPSDFPPRDPRDFRNNRDSRSPQDDRVHRVPDNKRPEGGPFGPKKKKKSPAPPPSRNAPPRPHSPHSSPPPHRHMQATQRPHAPKPFPPKPVPAKTPTDWSKVAQWYDNLVGDEGSEFHREVVLPGTLRLLDAAQGLGGKKVLDVACGQGVFSRNLQGKGAEVTGIDAAEELIKAARERAADPESPETPAHAGPPIEYLVGDATDLKALPDAAFDLAACLLAIQNIHPSGAVFKAVSRVLKPGGKFVVVMMHPAFRSPKATFWGWLPPSETDTAGLQFRRVDKYLTPRKEPIVTHPGQKTGEYTWSFHQPIGHYIADARKAGLLIDALEEWPSHKVSDSGPRAPAENTARKEIPMFLALRAVKLP